MKPGIHLRREANPIPGVDTALATYGFDWLIVWEMIDHVRPVANSARFMRNVGSVLLATGLMAMPHGWHEFLGKAVAASLIIGDIGG